MSCLHIVGGGPAGLSAAHAAVTAGARVCLIDDNHAPGGQIWRGGPGKWVDPRAAELWTTLHAHPHFTHLQDAAVISAIDANTLLLDIDNDGVRMPFKRLLICSGARELFLPFAGWTLPGVVGAGGLQALIKGGMPVRGRPVVIAGSGPLLLASALSAMQAGARVAAIVEHKPWSRLAWFGLRLLLGHQKKFTQAAWLFAKLRRIPYLAGARIVEAKGQSALQSVVIEASGSQREIPCDFLAAGFGLVPSVGLAQALECDIASDAIAVDNQQRTNRPDIWAAGECTGIGGVDKALVEGRIAALGALGLQASARDLSACRQCHDFANLLARSFAPDASLRDMCRPDTIVCRCEDVAASRLTVHQDWREAKLNTRVGMGPCQGKTCGPACQFLFGWSLPASRTPLAPASAQALTRID